MLQLKQKLVAKGRIPLGIRKRKIWFMRSQNMFLQYRRNGNDRYERSTIIKKLEKSIILHPIIRMEGKREQHFFVKKHLIQFLKRAGTEKELMPYYRNLLQKALEEERYYYKTRPSMTGRLLYGLMGSRATFKLLTRFYFGSLQRNDFLSYSDNAEKENTGFLVHVLRDTKEGSMLTDQPLKQDFLEMREPEEKTDAKALYQPYQITREYHLSKEQMRSVIENVYQEIEKKLKNEHIRKGKG